ncbi:MAG TPA: contact-dependent growth inhibition system immunity protein [Dongiaceae bacterium]|nr:contact-dependent growth inhibition system immunity protein [Dongiaceae bacterium]
MGHRIVSSGGSTSSSTKRSELEQFATWFHQDWGVLFSTFEAAANAYVRQLPAKRKTTLRKELAAFLDEHGRAKRGGLLRWWLKLRAQGGPRDLREALQAFVQSI